MGHRKYSAPRRGSIAFRPRSRARSLEARVRTWGSLQSEKPSLAGFAGFKAGSIHVLMIDDREKTPNFGKQLLSAATVVATPPVTVIGIRAYSKNLYGEHALFDVFAKDVPKELKRRFNASSADDALTKAEEKIGGAKTIVAVVAVLPNSVGLSQKKPFVYEIPITGKDVKASYDYIKTLLGKQVKMADVFQVGQFVDVSGITRGKGVEGPITRFGVKRKQHKSRKSVRAVGTLGPISPAVVMYTVARQGQRGFHQRTEYNKRILISSNSEKDGDASVNPPGGFKHYGIVGGDYIVVRGSIPGVPKRLVKMRHPIREASRKILEPKIMEVISH